MIRKCKRFHENFFMKIFRGSSNGSSKKCKRFFVSVFIGDDPPEGGVLSRELEQQNDESVFMRSQMFFLMKALS